MTYYYLQITFSIEIKWILSELWGRGERKMPHCSVPRAGGTARGDKETCVCANKAWASSLKDAFVTPKLEIGNVCGQKQQRWKGEKTNYYYCCICVLGYLYNVLNFFCWENVCHISENETLPWEGVFMLLAQCCFFFFPLKNYFLHFSLLSTCLSVNTLLFLHKCASCFSFSSIWQLLVSSKEREEK